MINWAEFGLPGRTGFGRDWLSEQWGSTSGVFGSVWDIGESFFPNQLPIFGGSLPSAIYDWSIIAEAPYPIPVPAGAPAPVTGDEDMAIDWGGLFGTVVESAATNYFAPTPSFAPWSPPAPLPAPTVVTPPAVGSSVQEVLFGETDCGLDGKGWGGNPPPKGYKVVNYCGQAVLRKIRRRRRRRILSASDAADIATIVGLVGKGQMASSLINRRP